MTEITRLLVVDDDSESCALLAAKLRVRGFAVTTELHSSSVPELLASDRFDVVLTDLRMKGVDGIALCTWLVGLHPELPVLVMTAYGSLDSAVAAIRAGAYDFLTKPFDFDALELTLNRAVRHGRLRAEVQRLRLVVDEPRSLDGILGQDPALAVCSDLVRRVAPSRASVLITGETGTGKGVFARALHRGSPRAQRAFVSVNCSAIPAALLESELFGHVRGAFTDAKTERGGLVQSAHQGTLFLDEIGDMPAELQAKLLSLLEEGCVRPVGSDQEVEVDLRIVAASNQDLELAVEEGRFREDLLYRLNVIHIELPPLRERGNDVLLLAQHYVEHFAAELDKRVRGLSSPVAARLLDYSWPGNVRELRNCIQRAVLLTEHDNVILDDLSPKIRGGAALVSSPAGGPSPSLTLAQVEEWHIGRVLEEAGGNKSAAARVLGITRKTLRRKLMRPAT